MGISINQTYAKIGIDRAPSRLDIQTENARLGLHQLQAKINIHTELPKVQIDQYEAFASAGLKNNIDLTDEAAQKGQQQALEYIGKMAGDGNRLAAVEKGGNPIKEIAIRDAYPVHEFGLTFIPKTGPKISASGSIEFNLENSEAGVNNWVEADFTPGNVSLDFTPSQISVYLREYASININYQAGDKIDYQV